MTMTAAAFPVVALKEFETEVGAELAKAEGPHPVIEMIQTANLNSRNGVLLWPALQLARMVAIERRTTAGFPLQLGLSSVDL